MGNRTARRRAWLVAALLAVLTAAAFLPVREAGFVSDDDLYVVENPLVLEGLTARGVAAAFTRTVAANWHPLTMLSLMLDAELLGTEPAGFHLVNVALHLAGTVLCFLALRRLTGATWRSALAAAIFAVHPARAESVAWIAERKDVLSGVFFWLTVGAYTRYASRPSPRRAAAVTVLLALGLLAKPMLVTVPLLLLVFDAWPLGRLHAARASWLPLLREKLPWLALAAVFSAITLVAQSGGGAVRSIEDFPLAWRLQNALLSWVRYLGIAFWPARLSFLHPFPAEPGAAAAAGALALLSALSAGAWALRRRLPALAAGWCWYLGMLVPVIGIVQVGSQAMADRYLYLPLAGLTLAVVWSAADLLGARPALRPWGALAGAAAVAALTVATHAQTRLWESGLTLFRHALAVADEHERWLAHYGIGTALSAAGDLAGAREHYRASIALHPEWAGSRNNLATIDLKQGRAAAALAGFREAVRLAPRDPRGHYGAGLALAALGRHEEAVRAYGEALRLRPDFGVVYTDYGVSLAQLGRLVEAEAAFRAGARRLPRDPLPRYNLGLALSRQGREAEAAAAFRDAVRLRPSFAEAHNNLGASLMALGRTAEAIAAFRDALAAEPGHAAARENLERARAALGGRPPP